MKGPATVGVITPGSYSFNTGTEETMSVLSGVLFARLPGKKGFVPYKAGRRFKVAAQSSFDVRADADVAYLCTYKR